MAGRPAELTFRLDGAVKYEWPPQAWLEVPRIGEHVALPFGGSQTIFAIVRVVWLGPDSVDIHVKAA